MSRNEIEKEYYIILDLDPTASVEDTELSYYFFQRQLFSEDSDEYTVKSIVDLQQVRPWDKTNNHDSRKADHLQQLHEAYETLINPYLRGEYDKQFCGRDYDADVSEGSQDDDDLVGQDEDLEKLLHCQRAKLVDLQNRLILKCAEWQAGEDILGEEIERLERAYKQELDDQRRDYERKRSSFWARTKVFLFRSGARPLLEMDPKAPGLKIRKRIEENRDEREVAKSQVVQVVDLIVAADEQIEVVEKMLEDCEYCECLEDLGSLEVAAQPLRAGNEAMSKNSDAAGRSKRPRIESPFKQSKRPYLDRHSSFELALRMRV